LTTIVLVEPQRPANVGAAARAMKNFGLADLRLVGARHCLPRGDGHAEARALAWNAADVLDAAASFATLEEAVADLDFVGATSGRGDLAGEVVAPREFAREAASLPSGARAGLVFGREDHGLTNKELSCCRVRVRVPTVGEQPSLNLAQAVVVLAYELALASRPADAPLAEPRPAREGDIERLFAAARELGLKAGFLNAQAPDHVLLELRDLLARARPTSREIELLQGLVAQLRWATGHADNR